jgi:hypothetical protein
VTAAEDISVASEDRLRADLYNFLGLMLSGPPDQLLLDQCAGLSGDESELGKAISGLSRVAKASKRFSLDLGAVSYCPMQATI